jgi:hypothetical protein
VTSSRAAETESEVPLSLLSVISVSVSQSAAFEARALIPASIAVPPLAILATVIAGICIAPASPAMVFIAAETPAGRVAPFSVLVAPDLWTATSAAASAAASAAVCPPVPAPAVVHPFAIEAFPSNLASSASAPAPFSIGSAAEAAAGIARVELCIISEATSRTCC